MPYQIGGANCCPNNAAFETLLCFDCWVCLFCSKPVATVLGGVAAACSGPGAGNGGVRGSVSDCDTHQLQRVRQLPLWRPGRSACSTSCIHDAWAN